MMKPEIFYLAAPREHNSQGETDTSALMDVNGMHPLESLADLNYV